MGSGLFEVELCNDPTGHFVNLSLVSPFEAFHMCICGYVTFGDGWFGFREVDLRCS